MFNPDNPFLNLFNGKKRGINLEIQNRDSVTIDMARTAALITSAVMYTDFRDTYTLPERKAFKIGALLTFFSSYYTSMSMDTIPANTRLYSTTTFYDALERCCVQPREVNPAMDLLTAINTDFKAVFADNAPFGVSDGVTKLMRETHGGELRPSSSRQITLWESAASKLESEYRNACRKTDLRSEAYDGAAPFVFGVISTLKTQIALHKKGQPQQLIF